MNKIAGRYVLLVITALVVFVFLFRDRSPFGRNNTSFAIKPGTEITGIEFLQGNRKLSLQKSGEKWFLNKTTETRKSAILFFIRTLNEMKIKSPVSKEVFQTEITDKKVEPVKVNVYHNMTLIKKFYVYKTGSNIYGNIMKMRISSKPFIVAIPGYEDNIGTHFTMNELFWQPYTVFNYLPSAILSVELKNYKDPQSSFMIKNQKSTLTLTSETGIQTGWDTIKVKRYLSYFTTLPFETWAFDLNEAEIKEITSSSPLYKIILTRQDSKRIALSIWEKWKFVNGSKILDTDRVWGKIDDRGDQIFVMRYFDIDPILKKKSYFMKD
jgi:hypothetical protein